MVSWYAAGVCCKIKAAQGFRTNKCGSTSLFSLVCQHGVTVYTVCAHTHTGVYVVSGTTFTTCWLLKASGRD